jgi:hypothetical protein
LDWKAGDDVEHAESSFVVPSGVGLLEAGLAISSAELQAAVDWLHLNTEGEGLIGFLSDDEVGPCVPTGSLVDEEIIASLGGIVPVTVVLAVDSFTLGNEGVLDGTVFNGLDVEVWAAAHVDSVGDLDDAGLELLKVP